MIEEKTPDYKKCIYLTRVDYAITINGPIPIYKCIKGHYQCQNSILDKPCKDFKER